MGPVSVSLRRARRPYLAVRVDRWGSLPTCSLFAAMSTRHPGDLPGLGVELDDEAARGYPYQRAYLPFNRLHDGTVHDW
jgi:hypothetical protein